MRNSTKEVLLIMVDMVDAEIDDLFIYMKKNSPI